MSVTGMARLLRKILVITVIAVLVIGTTTQFAPLRAALADTGQQTGMMADCDQPMPPAKQMPGCIEHTGCLCVPTLPAAPAASAVPFRWTSIHYAPGTEVLAGRSVKPELLPPILAG
jgi:hypothetical protein